MEIGLYIVDMDYSYKKLKELNSEFGDAFYIFDNHIVESTIKSFYDSFSSSKNDLIIAYPFKTCFLFPLIRTAENNGCYAEVASDYEYALANHAGFKNNRIVFNGPYKDFDLVIKILKAGGYVNLDSCYEVEQLIHLMKSSNINVGLRCNFDVDERVSRFGIDCKSNMIFDVAKKLTENSIGINGLHCHIKCRDLESWRIKTRKLVSIYNSLIERGYGDKIEYLDLGGGFHYGKAKEYASVIIDELQGIPSNIRIILEPGAGISEGCLDFCSRIVNENVVDNTKYVTMAGCVADVSAIRKYPPSDVLSFKQNETDSQMEVKICGFTCMEDDIIVHSHQEYLSVDDFVVFKGVGAYSSALRSNFIRGYAPVISYNSNQFTLCRSNASFDYYIMSSGQ